MTDFVGAARRITAPEVALESKRYGIDLPGCRALMDVESKNKGFDYKNRPIILFEPHIFYRQLRGSKRDVAERLGIAYPNWKNSYPSGSDAQYKRLVTAIKIDEEAAYRSISMGMGQVLGVNYHLAGCTSAKEMFQQAMESEQAQLHHMLEYLKHENLLTCVNLHQWLKLANGYNGRGQAAKYAGWLKAAHNRWERILGTPREELTAQDLREAGSEIVAGADAGQKAVKAAAVVGPSAGVALLETTKGVIEPLHEAVETAKKSKDSWDWLSDNWGFVAALGLTALFLVLCYFAYKAFHNVIEQRVQNAREGMNLRI